MKIDLDAEAATIALAETVTGMLPADVSGWTVLLSGELGAGKSTFARAVIHAMGHTGPVPSPTYTLVEPYRLRSATIYHVDLYRINSEDELQFLGWNELDDGFRLVEWPDRVPALRQQADLQVALQYQGQGRAAEVSGLSDRGAALVDRLVSAGSRAGIK